MQSRSARRWQLAAMALLSAFCAGCVQETRSGDSVKYTYELWVPTSLLLAGIAGVVIGGVLWSFQNRFKWVCIIFGLIGVVLGPSMYLDYAQVDSQGLEIRTGIPYVASIEKVRFDDIQQVRETKKVTRGRRGRKTTNYYYEFDIKSGDTVAVSVTGNELRMQARRRIDEQLIARGIEVVHDFVD